MLLKCPRCENRFEAHPGEGDTHVVCPQCSARLRLKPRSAPAPPTDAGSITSESPGPAPLAPGEAPPAPPQSSMPRGSSKSREKEVPLPAGMKLGGFEVRRVLGRGGMATVYKATQLSLNRPVAVKVLAARFSKNPSFVERFEREAGALANLNHPNIVNIIDKGIVENHYFFVMEMVEGITLDQLLQQVELTERHYTHIIGEISKALTYVHSKGIIHRDIKPSNILVNRQGAVKVSDFGIAHITDGAMPPEQFGRNATVGTAHYMSPEQATAPATVDQRADVYSLAVTFYKMFTRALPQGPPGSTIAAPSMVNKQLPRILDNVLLRAMHPDRNQRPQNVSEFCDGLLRCFLPSGGQGAAMPGGLIAAAGSETSEPGLVLAENGELLFAANLFSSSQTAPLAHSSSIGASSSAGLAAALAGGPSSATGYPFSPGFSSGSRTAASDGSDHTSGSGSTSSTSSTAFALTASSFGDTTSFGGGSGLSTPSSFSAGSLSGSASLFGGAASYPGAPRVAAAQPEVDPAAQAAIDQQRANKKKKLVVIATVVTVVLIVIAVVVVNWWLKYDAYGRLNLNRQ